MKYLLTLYREDRPLEEWASDELDAAFAAWDEFHRAATEAGVLLASEALKAGDTASTMRLGDDGERPVTDGPFAETKEQLGGFVLIECAGRDEVLEWARKVPVREGTTIEVREVMDWRAVAAERERAAGAAA